MPGAAADVATGALVDHRVELILWHLELDHALARHLLVGHLAVLAHLAAKALRDDHVERGAHEERLDAHVEQAADRARRVVGVKRREHHVTGERRLDRDLGGLEVTNLTDHDDVGILTQERTQRRGEVQADRLVHLALVDAREVELDRILGGRDVGLDLVQLRERRVQRRRLAGTGRPRHQTHPVRAVDALLEDGQWFWIKAELGHVELEVRFVQQAHDDFLAKERGQHADAEVHLLAASHLELDTTILRQAALGDVEVAHDLDTRADRGLEL